LADRSDLLTWHQFGERTSQHRIIKSFIAFYTYPAHIKKPLCNRPTVAPGFFGWAETRAQIGDSRAILIIAELFD
jgi:hypothetical protein